MKTRMSHPRILSVDGYLEPFAQEILRRIEHYKDTRTRLLGDNSIIALADNYKKYGLHRTQEGWTIREHAPYAKQVTIFGDFNSWNRDEYALSPLPGGDWALSLPTDCGIAAGQRYLLQIITADGSCLDRIPAYANRAVQVPGGIQYDAQVTDSAFTWHDADCAASFSQPLYIYECHVGMAQEEESIGTYRAFADQVLPRVKADGYNAIQLMAIQEHPYYASFGYQITNPYAASSRYGEADDLKYLVDTAHQMGLKVLLDLVHSHIASNEREGICNFDGSGELYCQGHHPAWGSRLINYQRDDVLTYLLGNIKYWMDEYHFDGFRFDGVTSMIYHDHGLGRAFVSYADYFSANTDLSALTYLTLATELIHAVNPHALAICEDMSGYPGMCLPIVWGGVGFDYRLNMGVPDMWIKFIKEYRDQDWDMFKLWHELSTRRPQEKTVGYAESHDQALVGDKTIIFRLLDAEMYTGMSREYTTPTMDRGMALSKLIRFITLSAASDAYLNFMGNEFGHPEWIDFPREGNGWSYSYARRQWSLQDNPNLKYGQLSAFDRDMLAFEKKHKCLTGDMQSLWIDQERKLIAFRRGKCVFLFNFHPTDDAEYVPCAQLQQGEYRVVFHSDKAEYGGFNRISEVFSLTENGQMNGHLPARTCAVLLRVAK